MNPNRRNLPKSNRSTITVLHGGANRGAQRGMPMYADFNGASARIQLVPRYVDPVPGRATALARIASASGIDADAVEGRIEEEIREAEGSTPVVLSVDKPETIASSLAAVEEAARPVLAYLMLKFPTGELWGLRLTLTADDSTGRADARRLFEALGRVTARRGFAAVFGAGAPSEHVATEEVFRRWMADHGRENLGKITAGVIPDAYPIEATDDGTTTMPVIVVRHETWADPTTLAERLAANPPIPLMRGESFVIAELGPDGVRFHKIRYRTDGQLSVRGMVILDSATYQAALDAEARRRQAEEAVSSAERFAITRRSPIVTTD